MMYYIYLLIILVIFVDSPKIYGIKMVEVALIVLLPIFPMLAIKHRFSLKQNSGLWLLLLLMLLSSIMVLFAPEIPNEAYYYQWAKGIFYPDIISLSYIFRVALLFVLVYVVSISIRSMHTLNRVLSLLMVVGGACSLIGIIEEAMYVFFKKEFLKTVNIGFLSGYDLPVVRISGFCNEPASFASLLNCIMIPFFIFYLMRKYFISKRVTFICISLYILASFFTFSTGGWFSIVLTILYILISSPQFRKRINIKTVIFVLLLLTVVYKPLSRIEGMGFYLTGHFNKTIGEARYGIRQTLQHTALEIFFDNPVTGVGIGRFPNFVGIYRSHGDGVSEYDIYKMSATNDYLQIAAENGILGCIVVLFIVFMIFREYTYLLKMNNEISVYGIALFSGILATLMHMIVGTIFYMVYFWLLIALFFQLRLIHKKSALASKLEK